MSFKTQKHSFALYYPDLRMQTSVFLITDELIVHRISRVLRFETGDELIFFNNQMHATIKIRALDKHSISAEIIATKKNQIFTPHIIALIPVLKRESLEEAVYNAVECAVNEIQLIITEKTQRAWGGLKELERLQKICIAAAEQSKHFIIPLLKSPKPFSEMVHDAAKSAFVFFDAEGKTFSETIKIMRERNHQHITLLFGPEADLSLSEKETLNNMNVLFTKLTPTILRAQQAVAVGAGALRSLLGHNTVQ